LAWEGHSAPPADSAELREDAVELVEARVRDVDRALAFAVVGQRDACAQRLAEPDLEVPNVGRLRLRLGLGLSGVPGSALRLADGPLLRDRLLRQLLARRDARGGEQSAPVAFGQFAVLDVLEDRRGQLQEP
jgi:hypothetical protein